MGGRLVGAGVGAVEGGSDTSGVKTALHTIQESANTCSPTTIA